MAKVYSLNEGSYSVDHSKKFIPFDPAVHNPKDRPASLFVHIQPFLLDTGDELILFDTGLGYKNENGELLIHENIRKTGYEPEDVTMVLMSHLHFDHAGGMAVNQNGKWQLSFPQATYFIQQGEIEQALTKSSKSYQTETIELIRRTSNLHLLNGSGTIRPGISYELTGGHCEYHHVFLVDTNHEKYFFGGDVMPEAIQVQRKFVAKYDFDGRKSMELREYFAKKAVEESWYCLMYHDKKNAVVQFALDNGAFIIK